MISPMWYALCMEMRATEGAIFARVASSAFSTKCHDTVELFDGRFPLLWIELEGVIVVSRLLRMLAFHTGEIGGIPEDQVRYQLAHGMVFAV